MLRTLGTNITQVYETRHPEVFKNILKSRTMVKYKKRLEFLKQKQMWWDKQTQAYKNATTRPASIKTR